MIKFKKKAGFDRFLDCWRTGQKSRGLRNFELTYILRFPFYYRVVIVSLEFIYFILFKTFLLYVGGTPLATLTQLFIIISRAGMIAQRVARVML